MSTIRERAIPGFRIPLSKEKVYLYDANTNLRLDTFNSPNPDIVYSGFQNTSSENHQDWVALSKAIRNNRPSPVPPGRDWGGDFTMLKVWTEGGIPSFFHTKSKPVFSSSWGRDVIVERFFPCYIPLSYFSGSLFPSFARSSDATLNKVGATAISRCSPTNPVASLGVATLEGYKDGLPHLLGHTLWQDKTALARSAGAEYLNVEFGWNPLVSDVKDFANGVANMGRLQKQFIQDSGKDVRRRYSFPLSRVVASSTIATNVAVGGPFDLTGRNDQQSGIPNGVVTRDRLTTVEQWFSGAFTYHAPDYFGSTLDHASHAVDILGLDLNPELLWQLAPWSWAADWFSNTGDVINNLDNYSKYGLILRRGYIMEHTIVRDTYSLSGQNNCGFDPRYVSCSARPPVVSFIAESKVRRRATPFGFGFDASGLTPEHLAIMAALGLVFLA